MKIDDDHLYHGAALIQIAEDPHFTAINSLKLKKKTLRTTYKVNGNIAVYLKYARRPTKAFKEYRFTFHKDNIKELTDISRVVENLFLALVCVKSQEVCCLAYPEFTELIERRKGAKKADEDQYTILVTIRQRKSMRVYVNEPGKKKKMLSPPLIVSRKSFPTKLFEIDPDVQTETQGKAQSREVVSMRPKTLKSAAKAGDLDAVKYHLAQGAKINAITAAGHFALGGAIIHGHSHVVEFLIARGANVNLKSEYGWTPLYLAAWTGNAEIAVLLLSAGARINTKTVGGWNSPYGYSPLHIAAANGSLDVVKLLVASGARVNARNGESKTPLDIATEQGHTRVVRFLKTAATKPLSNHARVRANFSAC